MTVIRLGVNVFILMIGELNKGSSSYTKVNELKGDEIQNGY